MTSRVEKAVPADSSEKGHLGCLILPLGILTAFMLVVLLGTVWNLVEQIRSERYAKVRGLVTESRNYKKDLVIKYEFAVDGVTYRGMRYRFTTVPEEGARAYSEKHPEGSAIDVYYDPDDPDRCLLVPGWSAWDFGALFPGAFLLVLSLGGWAWVVWIWRGRRRRR